MTELMIPARFNGPPASGNGGYVAGRLAIALIGDTSTATVEVTLRRPPPLQRSLAFTAGQLLDGEDVVAKARIVPDDDLGELVDAVDPATAQAAMAGFAGLQAHPFPTCFVCGTARPHADGLGLFAGPVGDGRVATTFIAREDVARDGVIGPEIMWCALDCPGGWSMDLPGRPAVLGRMTARVLGAPQVGQGCVVVGQLDGAQGRKLFTRSAVFDADGIELARARATWIALP